MSRKVVIMTDSTADLSKEILKKYEIKSVPLTVNFGTESYKDGIDISTEDLYVKVEEKGALPTTSAISPGEFHTYFKELIDLDVDIVYISIGSVISGTYQSANLAKEEFPKGRIFLVDSLNLSSGIALLVLKAVRLRDEGLSAKEIKKAIDKIVPKVRSSFAIKTLEYLHKGGRATGLQKFFGRILRIKPIIEVRNGHLIAAEKSFGNMIKASDKQLEKYFEQIENDNVDLEYVMVTHSIAHEEAKYMIFEINTHSNPLNLIESKAGCVISTHCGAGTIGILYIVKE